MKSKPVPLTEDEVKSIINAAADNRRDYLILRILAKTGMRVGELHKINVQDIDFKNSLIYIPVAKNDERREVPLDIVTGQILRAWVQECNHGQIWKSLSYRALQDIPARYASKAGLTKKVSCHSMRHFFGTDLIRNGMSEFRVQKLMGHKNVSTTMLYTHLVTSDVVPEYNRIMNKW